jgi:LmbE family N-acetylglucosaminyl deacetylase
MQWQNPQLVVDISDVIELKLRALACHVSQFGDFQAVERRVRQRSAEIGQGKGYAHAEGFDHIVMP